ncbi:NB-ARC domain-containing protein [Amycolatopsis sp. VS8301801F10]|uniref:NB-ARC domain-containing protein n=1 Tax=Amycolatopsis sp. VS8301801F10 TaxID=2652442 RepID=UPI0038FC2179
MLRSAPRRFVDREAERDELIEQVSLARAQREQGVFVLQGMGGVGKTALMLWCVRELAPSFDLVLEVSMGASAEAKTVEEILDVFLVQLEPRVTPPTLDGKLAVYRAETARRDVLVVLDDVDSAESVEQLIPASPAGVVLATSRQRLEAFEFAGFATMRLDVLSEPYGIELLSQGLDPAVAAEEERALADIAKLAGYLPLALTIAGAQLRARRHERPSALLARLESAQDFLAEFQVDRDRKLEFVYEASYQALQPREQMLYRRLGLFPGRQFPVWAASLLLGEGTPAQDALLALSRATLVGELADGRYEMHSIIHRHAQRHADEAEHPADIRNLRRALGEAYLDFASARELVLSSRLHFGSRFDGRLAPAYAGEDGYRRAVGDLETEMPNLRRIVSMAAEEGFSDLTWELAEAVANFLFQRGRYADAIAVHLLGLAAARQVCQETGDVRPLVVLHTELGKAYYSVHEHALAAEQFAFAAERTDRIAEAAVAVPVLAKTLVWQGLVHSRLGRYGTAVECLERSAQLVADPAFPAGLRLREERLLDMNGAPILAKAGRVAEGIEAAERAAAHFGADTDQANHAKSVANLGEVLSGVDDARAEEHLRSALAWEKELGIVDFEAYTGEVLGKLLKRTGRTEEGNVVLARAAELYELLADQRAEALRADLRD